MTRRFDAFALIVVLGLWGCASAPTPEAVEEEAASVAAAEPALDPEDPTLLRRPFTAEEIRAEWIQGLTLKIRRSSPGGEIVERWTVVAADAEGVDIEYATLDADGDVVSEPAVRRSGWLELRDHASFKADRSTREETTRGTSLGELQGWLYTVRDEETGTVTEFFFAKSLPGAPVEMRILKDGEPFMELVQLERYRPQ
ncbi:MAG: hypothetical protein GY856_53550 [bacterium]|nr:hypothetical protein [bacterium]